MGRFHKTHSSVWICNEGKEQAYIKTSAWFITRNGPCGEIMDGPYDTKKEAVATLPEFAAVGAKTAGYQVSKIGCIFRFEKVERW